jgi:drug/metabolite transporter (DMT)-like permease
MDTASIAPWAWIPIVVWAAFAQTIRNAAQRSLVSDMGTLGATLVRFLYGLPFAGAWLLLVWAWSAPGTPLPALHIEYMLWLMLGAACQLGATACLLVAMKQRNFIVGVAFSKTEVLQVGVFATLILQEIPTWLSGLAMVVATIGVVLLSLPRQLDGKALKGSGSAAWFGLASGALFALSSVGYRGAALELPGHSAWLIGAFNVLLAQLMQSLVLGAWLGWRQPAVLGAIARAWKLSTLAGMMGALASIGWLTAMALRPAVDVRTLGLVEVLFSYLVSRRLFREKISRNELLGLMLVGAGVLVVSAQF